MNAAAPHYLLFSETSTRTKSSGDKTGRWRFVLETVDGSNRFEAADDEPDALGDRLELLGVVRGLEALDQPSKVTLITPSGYVSRGLRFGLEQWRENNWQWESFGEWKPVKNQDLWRRVDRAISIHTVECRAWRFDAPDDSANRPPADETSASGVPRPSKAFRRRMGRSFPADKLSAEGEGASDESGASSEGSGSIWSRLADGARRLLGK